MVEQFQYLIDGGKKAKEYEKKQQYKASNGKRNARQCTLQQIKMQYINPWQIVRKKNINREAK